MAGRRIFVYDGREFPDPGEGVTVEEYRQELAGFYPELSNAKTEEKKQGEDTVYEFKKVVGTKGQTEVREYRTPEPEPIVFKSEDSLWQMLAEEGVTGIPAKPFDMRRWDMGQEGDDRLYRLTAFQVEPVVAPAVHFLAESTLQAISRDPKSSPEVPSITFLNKATGERLTRQYVGMEFPAWAPGWVFLLLGERV
ncbi:hypothetical protein LCGC14_2133530 [marine sediment metagenome]|uniref:Uncharacterized protein n=1 Tax=marine sediment metagenome TaxID=412755 RepID=A0A0F9E0Q6_9ZZZZ